MSKHVFIIKEQLCQSFWQLVKAFRFEAKKVEGAFPPYHFEASRVNIFQKNQLNKRFNQNIQIEI